MVALALLGASHASAQVVEERESEANPASAIFRATLYGAGTGLAIGGAYALIADGDDPSTGEILRWGTALGAGAGVVVGLLYVATRSEPEGSVDKIGMLQVDDGELSMSPLGLLSVEPRRTPPGMSRGLDLSLVGVRF
jgi:hypothetical protein